MFLLSDETLLKANNSKSLANKNKSIIKSNFVSVTTPKYTLLRIPKTLLRIWWYKDIDLGRKG